MELGIVGGVALSSSKNFNVSTGNWESAAKSFVEGVYSQKEKIGLATLSSILGGRDDTASAVDAGLAGQGLFLNPKLEVLFRGVKHREFELIFDLAPTTATDSIKVITFLRDLHIFAAPDLPGDKAFFEFPKTTTVVIKGDGASGGGVTLNRGNCAITGIDCNMTPDGVWASFKNGQPVHISITIKFLEMNLPTKDNAKSLFG
jgi:hypothetical protein